MKRIFFISQDVNFYSTIKLTIIHIEDIIDE